MRRVIFYGWVVVAVTAVVLLATAGVRAAPGAFLLSMQDEPGWSTGALSASPPRSDCSTYGLAGPISGRLMASIGIRGVTILSLVMTAGALIGSAFVREIWQLTIVFGFLAGLGSGLVASVLGPTIATRWFIRDRGFVTGILGASASAGQLIFFPVLTALAVTSGWRVGAVVMGDHRHRPDRPGRHLAPRRPRRRRVAPSRRRPRHADQPRRRKADVGVMRRAVRSVDFWFLASTFFVCGATSNGLIGQHFISHAADHGFTPVAASGALAVMGAFNFVGTISSGLLTDRFDPRKLLLDLLRVPRRQPAVPAVRPRHDGHRRVLDPVRARLHRDGAADRRPRGRQLRAPERGDRVRLGVRGAPARRGDRGGRGGIVRENVGDYTTAFVAAGWIAIIAGFAALGIRRRAPVLARAGDHR